MYSLLAFNPRHEFHWILSQWIIPAVKALVTVAYLGHCVCLLLSCYLLWDLWAISGWSSLVTNVKLPRYQTRLCLAENSSARWCPLFVDARGSYEECWEAGHQGTRAPDHQWPAEHCGCGCTWWPRMVPQKEAVISLAATNSDLSGS